MKRLDKPTKHKRDNLLNFKKKTAVSLKLLSKGKLSEYLKGTKSLFYGHLFLGLNPNYWKAIFFMFT